VKALLEVVLREDLIDRSVALETTRMQRQSILQVGDASQAAGRVLLGDVTDQPMDLVALV
jgi:hypothetical protein